MTLYVASTSITAPGILYLLSSNDQLVVNQGVNITSTDSFVVQVTGSQNLITNRGLIDGLANDAINIGAAGTTGNQLVNVGLIHSASDAVQIAGDASTVTNEGSIFGRWGLYYINGAGAGRATVTNSGSIAGEIVGILHSSAEDIKIANNGLIISSNENAILSNGTGSEMRVVNTGTIVGAIDMGDAADIYDGRGGVVTGNVLGAAGDDTFIAGLSEERFFGGGNTDTLVFNSAGGVTAALDNALVGTRAAAGDFYGGIENIIGSAIGGDLLRGNGGQNTITGRGGNDTLRGIDGSDALFGNAGVDSLFGGADIDFLYGGTGLDVLTGGSDTKDFFYCRDLGSVGDRVTDFGDVSGNNDKIMILNTAVAGSGLSLGAVGEGRFIIRGDNLAQQANDQFIFRTTDRTLWFDENGSGQGGRTLLFDFQAGATLQANDIIIYAEIM